MEQATIRAVQTLSRSILESVCTWEERGEVNGALFAGSCATAAKTRLNLVSREFCAFITPIQWREVVLHNEKDLGFFMNHLLPKYANTFRHLCLTVRALGSDTICLMHGSAAALAALRVANPRFASIGNQHHNPISLLYSIFRHTLAVSTTIDRVSLSNYDWSGEVMPGHQQHWVESGVHLRRLDLRCAVISQLNGVGLLLRLSRTTLEELRLETVDAKQRKVAISSGRALFSPWSSAPLEGPLFSKLQVLHCTRELIGPALLHAPNISNTLRTLCVVGSPDSFSVGPILDRYGPALDTMVFDDRQRTNWTWTRVGFDLFGDLERNRTAAKRHGIKLSWLLTLSKRQKGERDVCLVDLRDIIELV